MTGGGTATVAFAPETEPMGALADSDSDGTPEYYGAGRNARIQDITLQQALARLRTPSDAESVESYAQNLEGAFQVEAVVSADTYDKVHEIVFNDAGAGFVPGRAATSKWFVGIDYLNGTAERAPYGVTPTGFDVQWQQGGMVRYSLTAAYASEERSTSITPSNIVQPTKGTSVPFHDGDLTVDTVAQTKLQSATLSIDNIARLQFGEQREAMDAVIAAPNTTLDFTGILTETDQLDLAYGGGTPTPSDYLSGVSADLALSTNGTSVATYQMSEVTPDEYSWEDVINHDEDMTESLTCHVNGVTVA